MPRAILPRFRAADPPDVSIKILNLVRLVLQVEKVRFLKVREYD